jgi:rhodanese-related sulfurtransferase
MVRNCEKTEKQELLTGNMVKKFCMILLTVMWLTACGQSAEPTLVYRNITAEEARQIMDTAEEYILLDVRTQAEYEEAHIPGAILIPDTDIAERAEDMMPDKDRLILVYCRSGRRSKLAAETLVELGYTNIHEFGGIIDWPYQVEQGE